ncbi:TnsA endonuclease N-terminal domain-containing protein [Azonexus sp. IMCC34842]|uniref:TnsA endonuclease N-terminal domain-containing protein n=1 Tax=Azonexus sp. IMCC34842 TaxID=3420950 RepID=UPI003D0E8E73
MPVRNVVNRSGRGFRGYFPSRKMKKKMIGWESILERYAIYLFEFSPGVVSYCAQPELVYYPDGTELRKYYPDFKITTTGGISVRIEVKPSSKLLQKKHAEKYRAIATHYQLQEWNYQILTEQEIQREPLFSNLKKLRRHHRPTKELPSLLSQISIALKHGPQPLGVLKMKQSDIWRLLALGYLRCDLAAPITASTLISLPGGHNDETLYF